MEEFRGGVVFIPQDAEQQVRGIDGRTLKQLGFEERGLQGALRLPCQVQVLFILGVRPGIRVGWGEDLHLPAQVVQVHVQRIEYADCLSVTIAQQAQHQVLRPDEVMAQSQCLLLTVSNYIFYSR